MSGKILADWTRELRVEWMSVSRREFASMLGVSLGSVRNWEVGVSLPVPLHVRALYDLAKSVGYTTPMILDRLDTQTGVSLHYGRSLREEPEHYRPHIAGYR